MTKTWTCIARCGICWKELNRATRVPDGERSRVAISAALMAICDVREHNTFSDCNLRVDLEWFEEPIEGRPYVIGERKGEPYITCRACGMTSHDPEDVKHRYCDNCRRFLG